MGININTDISKINFLFFDVETTGLNPEDDRIIEIGGIKVCGSQILGEIGELINPERDIPEFITKLTGIDNQAVKGKPTFKHIYPRFAELSKDCILVAHNAEFDRDFLFEEIKRAGFFLPADMTAVCTLKLARVALPNLKNHKLGTLAEYFKIDTGSAHRAKDDAITCCKVFKGLIAILKDRMSWRRLMMIEGMV